MGDVMYEKSLYVGEDCSGHPASNYTKLKLSKARPRLASKLELQGHNVYIMYVRSTLTNM